MYLNHQHIFQLPLSGLPFFLLKPLLLSIWLQLIFFFFFLVKTEAGIVLNTGNSLSPLIFASLLFDVIVLYFNLFSFSSVFIVSFLMTFYVLLQLLVTLHFNLFFLLVSLKHLHQINSKLYVLVSRFCTSDFHFITIRKSLLLFLSCQHDIKKSK